MFDAAVTIEDQLRMEKLLATGALEVSCLKKRCFENESLDFLVTLNYDHIVKAQTKIKGNVNNFDIRYKKN